jgi:hypothetical protein
LAGRSAVTGSICAGAPAFFQVCANGGAAGCAPAGAGGARFVSLSGAPLARLDRGERPGALQRLLDMTANTMEPV